MFLMIIGDYLGTILGLPWKYMEMLSYLNSYWPSRNRELHCSELFGKPFPTVLHDHKLGYPILLERARRCSLTSWIVTHAQFVTMWGSFVFGDSCPHHIPWPCLWIYNVYDMDPYTYCIYIHILSLLLEAISLWTIWVVRPRGSHIVPHLAEEWWISLRAPSQWILIWLTHKSPGEVRHFSIFFRYPSPASHQQKVQDPSFFPLDPFGWLRDLFLTDTRWIWDGTQNLRLRRVTPRGLDMSGGQNYLLPAMDMAKVGGPLPLLKVCTSMLCTKIGYR